MLCFLCGGTGVIHVPSVIGIDLRGERTRPCTDERCRRERILAMTDGYDPTEPAMPAPLTADHNVLWGANTPRCTCGKPWCTHIMVDIVNRRDTISFRDVSKAKVMVPMSRLRLQEKRTIPCVQAQVTHPPVADLRQHRTYEVAGIDMPYFEDRLVVGYLTFDELHRRDIRELFIPILAGWEIDNPCECNRKYDFTNAKSLTRAATHATYRIMDHDHTTCWDCVVDDLIPDVSAAPF